MNSKRKAWIIEHFDKYGKLIYKTKVFKKQRVYKNRNIKGTDTIRIKLDF